MADEVHPVVELLIARMESHPEEFKDDYLISEVRPMTGSGRWHQAIRAIREHGLERDVEALNAALSKIRMQQIHEWTMDELLNGEDRRRAEEEAMERLVATATAAPASVSAITAHTGRYYGDAKP
jgi:hypothetical protein